MTNAVRSSIAQLVRLRKVRIITTFMKHSVNLAFERKMATNKMIPKTISKGPTKSKAGAGSQPLVASSSKSSGALRPRQASALPAGPQSSASEFSTLAATLQRLEEMEGEPNITCCIPGIKMLTSDFKRDF